MSKRKRITLSDLIPTAAVAELSVGDLELSPLGVGDLVGLFIRFPALGSIAEGEKITAEALMAISRVMPDAVPTVIATAAGKPGSKGVDLARNMAAGDQMKCIMKISDISFPEGIQSFFADLEGLGIKKDATAPLSETDQMELDVILDDVITL